MNLGLRIVGMLALKSKLLLAKYLGQNFLYTTVNMNDKVFYGHGSLLDAFDSGKTNLYQSYVNQPR